MPDLLLCFFKDSYRINHVLCASSREHFKVHDFAPGTGVVEEFNHFVYYVGTQDGTRKLEARVLEALRERTVTKVGSGRELILNSDKTDAGDGGVSRKHTLGCAGVSVLVVKPGQVVLNADKGDTDHLRALREAVPEEYNVVAHMSERKREMIRLNRGHQRERKASRKKNPEPASSLATPAREESLPTKALAPDDLTSSNQRKRKATVTVSGKKGSRTDAKIATNNFHDAETDKAGTSPMAEPMAGPRNDASSVLGNITTDITCFYKTK